MIARPSPSVEIGNVTLRQLTDHQHVVAAGAGIFFQSCAKIAASRTEEECARFDCW